jgi:hypothetical protein
VATDAGRHLPSRANGRRRVNSQFHDIGIYPSLWRTVIHQHIFPQACRVNGGDRARTGKGTYHFVPSSWAGVWMMTMQGVYCMAVGITELECMLYVSLV